MWFVCQENSYKHFEQDLKLNSEHHRAISCPNNLPFHVQLAVFKPHWQWQDCKQLFVTYIVRFETL